MRRVLVGVFGALFGTSLLVGLKVPGILAPAVVAGAPLDPAAPAGLGGEPGAGQDPAGTTAAPGAAATPGALPSPGETTPAPGGSTTEPPTGGTLTTTAGSSTTTSTTTTTTTTTASTTTVTGAAVAVKTAQSPTPMPSPCRDCHDYTMAVTITVSGGRITSTKVAFNTDPGGSLKYYNLAIDTLSPKVLTAQTWNLGRVSKATYSGNAFELSLRDAMSKAGLPI